MNPLSTNAADIVARIEGDVKVVRMRETRFKECANGEVPTGIQLTQLDMLGMEAQEMTSQLQAMEATRQVEEEEEEKAKRASIDAGKSPKKKLSDGEPEQRGQQHQGPEAGDTDERCVILVFFHACL